MGLTEGVFMSSLGILHQPLIQDPYSTSRSDKFCKKHKFVSFLYNPQ